MSFQPITSFSDNKDILKEIIIYSPFNCGSNLLEKLLKTLFSSIDYNMDLLPWKHKVVDIEYMPNRLHIFIIKQPFSWFLSILKSPYDLRIDKKKLFKKPVELKPPHIIKTPSTKFDNLCDVWITYYQKYKEFIKNETHMNCIFITYEDLLYQSEEVMIYFSQLWNITLPENYKQIIENIMKKPAKKHGLCNDYEKALDANRFNFLQQKYKNEYPEAIPLFFDYLEKKNITIDSHHQKLWFIQEWNELLKELPLSNPDVGNNSLQ